MAAGKYHSSTKMLEKLVGGQLTQNNLLNAAGGGAGPMTFNITQSFSGQETKPEIYRQIVYDTVTDLFRRARQ